MVEMRKRRVAASAAAEEECAHSIFISAAAAFLSFGLRAIIAY